LLSNPGSAHITLYRLKNTKYEKEEAANEEYHRSKFKLVPKDKSYT